MKSHKSAHLSNVLALQSQGCESQLSPVLQSPPSHHETCMLVQKYGNEADHETSNVQKGQILNCISWASMLFCEDYLVQT